MTENSTTSIRNKPRYLYALYVLAMLIILVLIGIAWAFMSRQRQAQELAMAKNLNLKVQYSQAEAFMQAGVFEQAREKLEDLIRQDPQFPGAMDMLSAASMQATMKKLTAEAPTTTPIPTETPTPLPTATPFPSPTVTEIIPPSLTPTNPASSENIGAIPHNALYIYVTQLDTDGNVGCGDSLVPLYIGRIRSGNLEADLKTSLDALFAAGRYPGGLYNATYPSNLTVDWINYNEIEKSAHVQLNGNYVTPADACDALRYRDQVKATAFQFTSIKEFIPYVGSSLLEDRLAVYSDGN